MENYKIEKVRMSDIRPSEVNKTIYNAHHEDRVRWLANDIKRNGLLEPLMVSNDGVIISGNTRHAALQLLGRTFVHIRRRHVHSGSKEFLELLVSANNQRIKTAKELVNETAVAFDPVAYWMERELELSEKRNAIDLQCVTGQLNSRRRLSDNYEDLAQAIERVLDENEAYLPMTLRGVHYQLLELRPIASHAIAKRKGEAAARYANLPKFYSLLSNVATKMRIEGRISFEALRDDGRKIEYNRGWDNMTSYLRDEMKTLFARYTRDLMQTQPYYIAIVCEKETVSNVLNKVALRFGVPVIYTKGGSSIDVRYRLLKDNERNGKKPMRLLILSDLDPAGYRIQDSFVGSLREDFGRSDVDAFRIGITQDQVKRYGLHSDMSAKESDNNYSKFVHATGMRKAYELDALRPEMLMSEVEEALRQVVDWDLYNYEVSERNIDAVQLERYRQGVVKYMADY